MSPRIKISSVLIERLKNLKECSTGQLFGIQDGKSVIVLGIMVPAGQDVDQKEKNVDVNYLWDQDLMANLPAGVSLCGCFEVTNKRTDSIVNSGSLGNIKGVPVVIHINFLSKEIISCLYKDDSLKIVEHSVIDENDLWKSFCLLRLTASIPLSCDFQNEHLQESISLMQNKILDGNAAFHISGTNIYFLGNSSSDVSGMSPESTAEELMSCVKESGEDLMENKIAVCNVNMFLKGSVDETSPQVAPIIKYVKKVFKHANIQMSIDCLSMVPREMKVKQLYSILAESVCRNLTLNDRCFLEQLKSDDVFNISLPQTYHFLPPVCGHFLSIVYPAKNSEDQLENVRKTFHTLLSLPVDKPLFRRGNAYDFVGATKKTEMKIVINPHEGLASSGVADGEPCLVQGNYAYHHYMQNKFDDNGWGCAYRSLQTIFSWFRLQGYTNMPVPTHKEIQQCLVKIGDKPSSFVGSKQWIGSTEVSFVLDTMLGVTCRIVNISSGEEMSMKGGELSYHFKTQGTPVMIGGGVLAHTIIGVDYNKKTGDIKFLILDPHYTGEEDLHVIQSKGWCGWKKLDFWKKDAFYNMCLPLRPKCV